MMTYILGIILPWASGVMVAAAFKFLSVEYSTNGFQLLNVKKNTEALRLEMFVRHVLPCSILTKLLNCMFYGLITAHTSEADSEALADESIRKNCMVEKW